MDYPQVNKPDGQPVRQIPLFTFFIPPAKMAVMVKYYSQIFPSVFEQTGFKSPACCMIIAIL